MINQRPLPRTYTKTISRSAADKPDYICDGIDDDVQINAAITAVSTAGGGTVFLKDGTYSVSAIVILKSNVRLTGESKVSTILKLKNSASALANGILGDNLVAIDSFSVENLTIDGNKANQTNLTRGIRMEGASSGSSVTNGLIANVLVKNIKKNVTGGVGIYMDYTDKVRIVDCNFDSNDDTGLFLGVVAGNSIIDRCISISNGGNGIAVGGVGLLGGIIISNCLVASNTNDGIDASGDYGPLISNCKSASNGGYGIDVGSQYSSVKGNICYNNTLAGIRLNYYNISCVGNILKNNTTYGIEENGDTNVTISANACDGNKKHGIYLNGTDNSSIMGNVVGSTGLDADNTYSCILLTGTATRNIVNGNRVSDAGGANNYAYGIREGSSSDNSNVVTSNIATSCQTAQVSLQGAQSVQANNITA